MPLVLWKHQFIMFENFETIYISTNRTVPFMSQSFIAGSAILCHFMPNDRSLLCSSLIRGSVNNFVNLCCAEFISGYFLMVFGLDKQSYNQTLNIKTDFENYIICDVSITVMTSCVGDVVEELRKRCIGCLQFFKYKCVLFNQFS